MLLALWVGSACSRPDESSGDPPSAPRLPNGQAGRILGRAIDAAGGWGRWRELRDVSYISTLTIVDAAREVTSDSIGWFAAPLHRGARARMDSIGLPTEVRFGIDDEHTWIMSEGRPVQAPGQLALTRFDMVSSLFWFSLPFALTELPAELTDLGETRGEDGRRLLRLKAEFETPHPAVPGPWVVLYLDAETGLIDHVHGRLSAPFLRHELWVGRWRHYRDCDGIRKERLRQFYPADEDGRVVGTMIAEQYVEHVRFNNGFDARYFDRPATGDDGNPVDAPPADGHRAGIRARLAPTSVESAVVIRAGIRVHSVAASMASLPRR